MLDKPIATHLFVPMAISLAFGVLIGTLITLLLVPCLYMVVEDFLALIGRREQQQGNSDLIN